MAQNCEAQTWTKVEQIKNPESRESAEQFIKERRANGITWRTLRSDLHTLRDLANHRPGKALADFEKNDIVSYLASIADHYADSMMARKKADIKKFYAWLENCPPKEYPDRVAWIRASGRGNGKPKNPDVLLSPDEVKALIESCDNPRDRALLAVLYESGARPHELLSLDVKNVELDPKGAVVRLNPEASKHTKLKTGTRRIRLVNSSPYLEEWLRHHPKDEGPLWISFANSSYGDRLSGQGLRGLINRIGNRSSVDKNLTPYLFRHSRATELARQGFTESDMKIMLGWTGGSDMPDTYIHMSGADVEEKILRFHGLLDEEEEEEDPLEPWKCPRKNCGHRNPADARFCGKCTLARTAQDAEELDEAEEDFTQPQKLVDKLDKLERITEDEDKLERLVKLVEKL